MLYIVLLYFFPPFCLSSLLHSFPLTFLSSSYFFLKCPQWCEVNNPPGFLFHCHLLEHVEPNQCLCLANEQNSLWWVDIELCAAHSHITLTYGLFKMSLLLFFLFSLSYFYNFCGVSVDFWCPFNGPSILLDMRQDISKCIASNLVASLKIRKWGYLAQ